MITLIKTIFDYGALIFGIGFLAPLITQIIARAGWPLPYDVQPLAIGLTIGGLWGLYAQWKGRWI